MFDKVSQCFGDGLRLLLWAYLSELPHIPTTLFYVVKYALDNPTLSIFNDYTHPYVMDMHKAVKSVGREKHRMEAFVRFEHTKDDVYFAKISPDFNVLPLTIPHFKNRYQDQDWAIYDTKRGYGVLLHDTKESIIVGLDKQVLDNPMAIWSQKQMIYQQFWQAYFFNTNIKQHANPNLHKQYLPRRYWHYLTKKQVHGNELFFAKTAIKKPRLSMVFKFTSFNFIL